MDLIYVGTKNGLNSAQFHKNCDAKGPTLNVIKTDTGATFGFYTEIPWYKSGNHHHQKGYAFLFKVEDYGIVHFPMSKATQLVKIYYSHVDLIATTDGVVYKLRLRDDNESNMAVIDEDQFVVPKDLDIDPRTYLAGAYNFKFTEIEVFKVISV